MSRDPKVTIVLLNWNGWQDTVACLTSLATATTPHDCLVVDNGSSDDSISRIQAAFPAVPLLPLPKNRGFTGGNNAGIVHALQQGADYVLLLNNDTIVAPDFLRPLIDTIEQDNQIAAVNPKIYFLDKTSGNRLWAAGGQMSLRWARGGNRGFGKIDKGQYDKLETIDFATGCCLLMRRAALEQVGLLDDRYFAYYEDTDWSFRARQHGYKLVYVPTSKVWHAVGAASKRPEQQQGEGTQSPFVHYLAARNQLWFLRKFGTNVQHLTAYPAYFVQRILFYTAVFLLLGRRKKLQALWRGFADGLFKFEPA